MSFWGLLGTTCASQAGFSFPNYGNSHDFVCLLAKEKLTSSFTTLSCRITFHNLKHVFAIMTPDHLDNSSVTNVRMSGSSPIIQEVLQFSVVIRITVL